MPAPARPEHHLISSILGGLAVGVGFLFPAAQLVRLLDQVGAAIDPRLSLVGSLHEVLVANASVLPLLALVAVAVWLIRRTRGATSAAGSVVGV